MSNCNITCNPKTNSCSGFVSFLSIVVSSSPHVTDQNNLHRFHSHRHLRRQDLQWEWTFSVNVREHRVRELVHEGV